MSNINIELLAEAGYRSFNDSAEIHALGEWYRASYQKRFTDSLGTKYFITIVHGIIPPHLGVDRERPFFAPSNQFTRRGSVIRVEMNVMNETLAEVEAFFEEIWTSMKFDYYEDGPPERNRWLREEEEIAALSKVPSS